MKLHINPIQAMEVREEDFYKIFNGDIVKRNDWAYFHHKKVNIGKMVEFLSDRDLELGQYSAGAGYVGIVCDDFNNKKWFNEMTGLCNALWEAIKYKLRTTTNS